MTWPVASALLILSAGASAWGDAGNPSAAQTSAPAVEERPSDCHEIVPAVIAFAKVPQRAVVFVELRPRWGRKGGKLVILSVEAGART